MRFYTIVAVCGALSTAEALYLQRPERGEPEVTESVRVAENINALNLIFANPMVQSLFNEKKNLSAIVVGANDGSVGNQSNDPMIDALNNINVRALMVEPNPPVFKTLETNLKTFPSSERLWPLNVAICTDEGAVPFYVVSEDFQSKCPRAPHWAKHELSSMSYTHVLDHWKRVGCGFQNRKEFEPFIQEISVPCWTPSHLMGLDGFKPEQIDFLLVDAEGFDDKVVSAFMRQLEFRPSLIIYEYIHLTKSAEQRLNHLLHERGYATERQDCNTIAYRDHRDHHHHHHHHHHHR